MMKLNYGNIIVLIANWCIQYSALSSFFDIYFNYLELFIKF